MAAVGSTCESCGTRTDPKNSDPVYCSFEESLQEGYSHGVHAMIWAPWSKLVLKKYDPMAAIFMHVRFDGHLGFPGGKVDENVNVLTAKEAKEKVTEALMRELEEEINMDTSLMKMTWDKNYHLTYAHPAKKYFLHFFALEITLKDFEKLELAAMKSKEFGHEVMGNFRVPLYTMDDGYRGLPAFINNKFIGTAKDELLKTCTKLGILTSEYIENTNQKAKIGLLKNDC